MRRPLDYSEDEPIEFLDGVTGAVPDDGEVRTGPSRPSIVVGVGAVAALLTIGAIATRGRGNGTISDARPDATTTVGATSTVPSVTADTTVTSDWTTYVEVSVPTLPATPSADTTAGDASSGGLAPLPFGVATGLELYLAPSGAPSSIEVYDIDAGTVRSVSLGGDIGWYQSAMSVGGRVVVDGGAVISVDGESLVEFTSPNSWGYDDAPFGRIAPGPGGAFWLRTFGASPRSSDPLREPSLVLVTADATPVGPSYPLVHGADLIGSRADGRPVVVAADGVAYTIESDGSRTLLARNVVGRVEAGGSSNGGAMTSNAARRSSVTRTARSRSARSRTGMPCIASNPTVRTSPASKARPCGCTTPTRAPRRSGFWPGSGSMVTSVPPSRPSCTSFQVDWALP